MEEHRDRALEGQAIGQKAGLKVGSRVTFNQDFKWPKETPGQSVIGRSSHQGKCPGVHW